jgi:hypothetical protein
MKKKAVAKKSSKSQKKSSPNKFRVWWRARKHWQRIVIKIFAILTILLFSVLVFNFVSDKLFPPIKNPEYGVTFSPQYAEELGVDWKENYIALLDELQFKRYRLMTYWNRIEKKPGKYDFSEIDFQMNEAAKRGYTVALALGLRQPRWPECHQPNWAKDLYKTNKDEWRKDLNEYITKTVERYKNHPALGSWQLENEAVNSWFGECQDRDKQRLRDEFALVKNLDPNHPVNMSLSDQHGFPAGTPVPDNYGFSVYRIVWNDKTPIKFYITYPTPVWYHRLRAFLINHIKHREVFIHELQVEPWGPVPTEQMTVEEQDRSMSPRQMEKNMIFARKIGKPGIYMWGSEWWYWRKTVQKDTQPWDRVKLELQRFPN